jgi:hypothetical protein
MDWTNWAEQIGKNLIQEVEFNIENHKQIKFDDYTIEFNNQIPTYESLSYCNESYPKIYIEMNIKQFNTLIYSVKLEFNGHYYCCGSQNFEFEEKDIKKTIIKDCDKSIKNDIYNKSIYLTKAFNGTVLKIWTTRIFDQLF